LAGLRVAGWPVSGLPVNGEAGAPGQADKKKVSSSQLAVAKRH